MKKKIDDSPVRFHSRTTKVCPSCGSEDIYLWMGAKAGMIYKCKKCGYTGPFVIEEDR